MSDNKIILTAAAIVFLILLLCLIFFHAGYVAGSCNNVYKRLCVTRSGKTSNIRTLRKLY